MAVINLHRRSTREGMVTIARNCNFEAGDKWYEHEPESVLEHED